MRPRPDRLILALALLGLSCEGGPSVPDARPEVQDLILRGLRPETTAEWDRTITRLLVREADGPSVRLALGELFLELYRQRDFVRERWREIPILGPYYHNRTDPAGSALLAEAAWMYASVVMQVVGPDERAQGVHRLIDVFREKQATITASISTNLPERVAEELTDIQRRFIWLGLNYIECALLLDRFEAFRQEEDLRALRQGLERRAELLGSFQKDCPPDGAFARSFEKNAADWKRIAGLEPDGMVEALEGYGMRRFIKPVSRHLGDAADAKSTAMDLVIGGASPVQVYEHVQWALLNYLYVVETSCPVHVSPPHPSSLSPESLKDARGTLLWALSRAQNSIKRPESP